MNAVTIYCKTPNEKYEHTDCQEGHWCQLSTFSLLTSGHQCFLQALQVCQGADQYTLMILYVFIPMSSLLTLHRLLGCVHYGLWVPQHLSAIMIARSNVRTMSWHNGLGQGWRSNFLYNVGTCLPTTCSHIPEEYNLLNMCKIVMALDTRHKKSWWKLNQVICISSNMVILVCDIMICWTAEQIFSICAFLGSLWYSIDGNLRFH
jgi:hypothetical protein